MTRQSIANRLRWLADKIAPPRGIPAADRGDHLDDSAWEEVHGDSPL